MAMAGIDPMTSSSTAFALDARALGALQARSRVAPEQALKQAATQFEAVFMNMLLKSMRDTIPQDGAFDSDTTRTYTGMFDQQLAQQLSGKGLGLADMLVKQLSRQISSKGPESAATPTNRVEKPAGIPLQPEGKTLKQVIERIQEGVGAATALSTAPRAQAFVERMLPHARAAEAATGLPARFVLAQAALESGWGRSEVRGADGRASNNLFGIKAGRDWKGPVVEARTTEYVNGVPLQTLQRFRAYATPAESFADYARLLTSSPRYREVLARGHDATGFATALQQAGYATDPRYAEKISRIIHTSLAGRVA